MPTVKLEDGEQWGPSWRDVALQMKDLEKEYRGRVVMELTLAPYGTSVLRLDLILRRSRGRNEWHSVAAVGGSWPTSTSRTMSALLSRLLWQLEDAIADYEARQAIAEDFPQGTLPPPPG